MVVFPFLTVAVVLTARPGQRSIAARMRALCLVAVNPSTLTSTFLTHTHRIWESLSIHKNAVFKSTVWQWLKIYILYFSMVSKEGRRVQSSLGTGTHINHLTSLSSLLWSLKAIVDPQLLEAIPITSQVYLNWAKPNSTVWLQSKPQLHLLCFPFFNLTHDREPFNCSCSWFFRLQFMLCSMVTFF